MTDLTDKSVRALLEGTTPGPWRADGEPWNRIVWSSADNRVCFMAHSSGLNDARDTATSNLVAAAPDLARTVIALHAQLADAKAVLEAKVAGLVEAAEDAEYDLLQWLECSKALTAAGFNMDGTAEVTAKLTAALSHIKRGKTNG